MFSAQPAKIEEISGKTMLQQIVARHPWLAAIGMGIAIAGVSASSSNAQCVESSERVPQIDLQAFSTEPVLLLRKLRNDKEKLAGRLTAYLVTDPTLLPSVRKLVNDAPIADRPAIGEALRHAEFRCVASQPEVARRINDFVRKLGDTAVLSGYSAAVEEPAAPSPPAKPRNSSAGLMSGEWKTELADPFKAMPLPQ
jgi:hypothetical protein